MRVDIYIRKENEEIWEGIPNKSEWINELLYERGEPSFSGVKKPTQAYESDFEKAPVKVNMCKNGHLIPTGRDKCTWKGCKYAK